MKQIVSKRDDVAFYLKMYPLIPLHKDAYAKSKSIVCALQNSNEEALKLLEDVYAKKTIPAPTCETTAVDDSMRVAESLGAHSTPTIVFQNGKIVAGAIDENTMNNYLSLQ